MAKAKTKEKPFSPFLARFAVTKEFRGLPNGLIIDFDKPFTALVGDNGTGKSSILDAIRTSYKIKDTSYFKHDLSGNVNLMMAKCIYEVKYYDFHADDAKFSSTFRDDMVSQIQAMSASSGLGSLGQFLNTGIPKSEKNLILLDEPCRGLSMKMQWKFLNLFHKLLLNGNQVILTTHSKIFMDYIDLIGEIYSVEHKKKMTAKEFEEDSYKNGLIR